MKGYRWFMVAFIAALILYIVWEIKKPEPIDWSVTLSKDDKNPFGSYVLYHQIGDLFPKATVQSSRLPAYDQLKDHSGVNTAYMLIAPQLDLGGEDINTLLDYAVTGNYVFIASDHLSKDLMDSLKFKISSSFESFKKDSVSVNFVNPALKTANGYSFKRMTLDAYLAQYDTAQSVILASNHLKAPVFIKIPYGDGAFFVDVNPLCFSNYFMLTRDNAGYTARALSYLPSTVGHIYWDEYYKVGAEGSQSSLRFLMKNTYLKWAYRLGIITLLLFVLFESKRRQRIIPVIEPLKNTTLEFVQTIGNAYFNKRDNKNIAAKKISYFYEFLRSKFYIQSVQQDEAFIELLAKKAGMPEQAIRNLLETIYSVQLSERVSDGSLLHLNELIDDFYNNAK